MQRCVVLFQQQGFEIRLKDHLLARLNSADAHEDLPTYSKEDRKTINFKDDRIFPHARLTLRYTTYNIRRGQDAINFKSPKCDVMVHSRGDNSNSKHSFWYARVVGVFHVNVIWNGSKAQRMEFLWVRWFERDATHKSGWQHRRLDRIKFTTYDSGEDDNAFGFIDPADVVRACHLIPCFHEGPTSDALPPSSVRKFGRVAKKSAQPLASSVLKGKGRLQDVGGLGEDEDYKYYYVDR